MPNAGPRQAASPDADLTRAQLAERWKDAAIHADVSHDDFAGLSLGLVVAADLLKGDRWTVEVLRKMLLDRLADLPYVEGCCTWRETP